MARGGPQGPISAPLRPSVSSAARRGADQPWRAPPPDTPCGARCAYPGNRRFCGAALRPLYSDGASRNRGTPWVRWSSPRPSQRQLRGAQRRAGLSPSPPLPTSRTAHVPHYGAPPRVASLRRHHDPLGGAGSPGLRPPASRRTAGLSSSRLPAHASDPAHQACRGAGRAPPTAARPARSRPDPAFDRRSRGVGGVRAEAGRVAAHLLRLPGPSRGLQCSRRFSATPSVGSLVSSPRTGANFRWPGDPAPPDGCQARTDATVSLAVCVCVPVAQRLHCAASAAMPSPPPAAAAPPAAAPPGFGRLGAPPSRGGASWLGKKRNR